MSLAIAGQVATSHAVDGAASSCPSRRSTKSVVLFDRFSQGEPRSLTQRVALALLSVVLAGGCT